MIQALAFLLVATTTASTAMPLVNFQRWTAPVQAANADVPVLVVKRADTPAQLAQGSNYFFQSLHLEAACTPGQFACVDGNVANCSPEANWEISPCPSGTQCYAVPDATFVDGVNVKCTTESEAQTAITEAGGDNTVAQDYSVSEAPFNGVVVDTVDPSSSSDAPTDTPTDAPSSTEEQPTPTDSTEDPNATCIPDDGEDNGDDNGDDQDGNIESASTDVPSFTATLGEPVPTDLTPSETADPNATCTDEPEEPIVTETITLVLVPNPTESGVYETSTLTGELPAATEPASSTESTETASATSEAVSVEPTESPSCTESYTDAPTETAAPSDATTSTEEPIQSSSSSVPPADAPSPTTLTIAPGFTSVPVNAGTNPTPDVNVVGNHQIPATPSQSPGVVKKRMEKKVKRS